MVIVSNLIGTPSRRIVTGCVLVAVAALAGLYFASYPAPTPLDRVVDRVVPNEWNSHLLQWAMGRFLTGALVLGTVISCAVAQFWDRRRAVACVATPAVAIAIAEYVMKPLVHRPIPPGALHGLSYPSGHMASTAAVVAAAVLAVPPRWRKGAVVVGTVVDVAVAACLILLRYHYVTDVLGGAALAIGTALFIDTALHLKAVRPPSAGIH